MGACQSGADSLRDEQVGRVESRGLLHLGGLEAEGEEGGSDADSDGYSMPFSPTHGQDQTARNEVRSLRSAVAILQQRVEDNQAWLWVTMVAMAVLGSALVVLAVTGRFARHGGSRSSEFDSTAVEPAFTVEQITLPETQMPFYLMVLTSIVGMLVQFPILGPPRMTTPTPAERQSIWSRARPWVREVAQLAMLALATAGAFQNAGRVVRTLKVLRGTSGSALVLSWRAFHVVAMLLVCSPNISNLCNMWALWSAMRAHAAFIRLHNPETLRHRPQLVRSDRWEVLRVLREANGRIMFGYMLVIGSLYGILWWVVVVVYLPIVFLYAWFAVPFIVLTALLNKLLVPVIIRLVKRELQGEDKVQRMYGVTWHRMDGDRWKEKALDHDQDVKDLARWSRLFGFDMGLRHWLPPLFLPCPPAEDLPAEELWEAYAVEVDALLQTGMTRYQWHLYCFFAVGMQTLLTIVVLTGVRFYCGCPYIKSLQLTLEERHLQTYVASLMSMVGPRLQLAGWIY